MKKHAFIAIGLALLAVTAFGADTASNSVVDIKMDNMIYHKREGYIELLDNVVLKIDDTVVKADKALIFQSKKGGKGKNAFEKIVATGHVKIDSPEGAVIGEKAVWTQDKNIVRFSGNPRVEHGNGHTVHAEAIIYNIITKTCSFEGRSSGKGKIKKSDRNKFL